MNGMFVNDGSMDAVWDIAPFEPGKLDINDYAVEAEVQIVRATDGCKNYFGMALRGDNATGYAVTISVRACAGPSNIADIYSSAVTSGPLEEKLFTAGPGWHLYRAEVKGNVIRLLIDGDPYLETTDNHFLTGGQVGLSTKSLEVNVRSFKVIKL